MPFAPVNVMVGEAALWQTAVVPAIVAVGNGLTLIVIAVVVLVQPPVYVVRLYVLSPGVDGFAVTGDPVVEFRLGPDHV